MPQSMEAKIIIEPLSSIMLFARNLTIYILIIFTIKIP